MADTVVPSTAPTHGRLSLGTKLAFGAGEISPGMSMMIIGFFQALFLTTVAGLSPGAAGLIILISRIWDAISDPLMGIISDRTRSRFGRRRLWIMLGAVPLGIIYFLLWWVPPVGETARFFYYLAVIIAFDVVFTMVTVPYTSLTAELTDNYDERTAINAFRFAFSGASSLIAVFIHGILATSFCADATRCLPEESQRGYLLSAAIFGLLFIPSLFWCAAGTHERYTESVAPKAPPLLVQLRALRTVLQNRHFLFLFGVYSFPALALQITQSVIGFHLTFYMQRADMFTLVLIILQVSTIIFLFVWNVVIQRIGRRTVYYSGLCIWIAAMIGLFFLGPDQVSLTVVIAALTGMGIATAHLVPWSLLPDVIDMDELMTGERREGIYYGFMAFIQKTCVGLGIALTLQALEWYGFNRNLLPGEQSESVLLALRWMVGPVPTVLLIIGMLCFYFYPSPLTRVHHEQTQAELVERRAVRGVTSA